MRETQRSTIHRQLVRTEHDQGSRHEQRFTYMHARDLELSSQGIVSIFEAVAGTGGDARRQQAMAVALDVLGSNPFID